MENLRQPPQCHLVALGPPAAVVARVLVGLVGDPGLVQVVAEQPMTPVQVVVILRARVQQDPGQPDLDALGGAAGHRVGQYGSPEAPTSPPWNTASATCLVSSTRPSSSSGHRRRRNRPRQPRRGAYGLYRRDLWHMQGPGPAVDT